MDEKAFLWKKRIGAGLLIAALALSLVLPTCSLIALFASYQMILWNYAVVIAFIFILTLSAVILLWKYGRSTSKNDRTTC